MVNHYLLRLEMLLVQEIEILERVRADRAVNALKRRLKDIRKERKKIKDKYIRI